MDTLIIEALTVNTKIGVHAFEQAIKQTLFIDINIPRDLSACDERLESTLDYDAICKTVTQVVESRTFSLIETVANEVADLIKSMFKVLQVTVAVSKPHAIKNAKTVKVVVNR